MKSKIMNIIILIVALFLLKECCGLFYIQMSHLTSDDLVWTNSMSRYPEINFISNRGRSSKLEDVTIHTSNDTNPFFISSAPGFFATYEANSYVYFKLNDNRQIIDGSFAICRTVNEDSLSIGGRLGGRSIDKYVFIEPHSMKIKDKVISNCITVDSVSSNIAEAWKNDSAQHIDRYTFSKEYGLVYYKLSDGEEFYRIFD